MRMKKITVAAISVAVLFVIFLAAIFTAVKLQQPPAQTVDHFWLAILYPRGYCRTASSGCKNNSRENRSSLEKTQISKRINWLELRKLLGTTKEDEDDGEEEGLKKIKDLCLNLEEEKKNLMLKLDIANETLEYAYNIESSSPNHQESIKNSEENCPRQDDQSR
ncbi:hypothetical protein Q3G72_034995 [Acer saccharum]|nr:hypothetical protein Q3G72_034995 [Acer saccharum]